MAYKGKVMPAPKPGKKKPVDGEEKTLPPWLQKKGKKTPAKKS